MTILALYSAFCACLSLSALLGVMVALRSNRKVFEYQRSHDERFMARQFQFLGEMAKEGLRARLAWFKEWDKRNNRDEGEEWKRG